MTMIMVMILINELTLTWHKVQSLQGHVTVKEEPMDGG